MFFSKSASNERVLPPGVVDFDAQNMDDPSQASEYAMETFQYYKNREVRDTSIVVAGIGHD